MAATTDVLRARRTIGAVAVGAAQLVGALESLVASWPGGIAAVAGVVLVAAIHIGLTVRTRLWQAQHERASAGFGVAMAAAVVVAAADSVATSRPAIHRRGQSDRGCV